MHLHLCCLYLNDVPNLIMAFKQIVCNFFLNIALLVIFTGFAMGNYALANELNKFYI